MRWMGAEVLHPFFNSRSLNPRSRRFRIGLVASHKPIGPQVWNKVIWAPLYECSHDVIHIYTELWYEAMWHSLATTFTIF